MAHDTLTGRDRIARILRREPVDRIGLFEHFWGDTETKWRREGHLGPDEAVSDHFGFDMELLWPFNMTADFRMTPEVVEETADTVLTRDGNGALLRRHKQHDATPEHVDFLVKDRSGWDAHIKPLLTPDADRINFDGYRAARDHARAHDRFFAWSGVNVFEMMHPVCGHEHLLVGMACDPDWVRDMADTFADTMIALWDQLFEACELPDGIWFYEDMGLKGRPFFSLDMYRALIQPAHARTIAYAHNRGLPVIMHSCGFVEPLVPGMLEAGIDALQVIEVKAGMDLVRLFETYGDRLSFIGGIDVRVLYTNDRETIDRELLSKIPRVKWRFGYVLHSDHSIPNQVEYETYRYFVERGLELGRYGQANNEGGNLCLTSSSKSHCV